MLGSKVEDRRTKAKVLPGLRNQIGPCTGLRREITARWPGTSYAWARCMAEIDACSGQGNFALEGFSSSRLSTTGHREAQGGKPLAFNAFNDPCPWLTMKQVQGHSQAEL